jgi:hypothetical protein
VFAHPGNAIGDILTVTSTMGQGGKLLGSQSQHWLARFFLFLLGFAIAAIGSGVALDSVRFELMREYGVPNDALLLLAGLCGVGGGVVLALLKRPPPFTCTFVGTQGIARFEKSPQGLRSDVVRFQDAFNLLVERTRVIVNHNYSHTRFKYTWSDVSGTPKLVIEDRFRYEDREGRSHPIHFALAAEDAHLNAVLPMLLAASESPSGAFFRSTDGGGILVAKDRIELASRAGQHKVAPQDVGSMLVEQGRIVVRGRGAGAWQHEFDFSRLSNAKPLVALLRKRGILFS